MTSSYPPKTPPRRHRGSTLNPSPFVTPSKAPASGRQPRVQLISRLQSSPATTGGRLRTTTAATTPGRCNTKPSPDDRFIPSRRHTNLDLCRRALLSGEKRPISAAVSATTGTSPPTATMSQETPLQKEFKRRMLSSLCNVPLTKLDEEGEPTGLLSFGGPIENRRDKSTVVLENPFSHDLLRTMKLGENRGLDAVEDLSVAKKVLRKVPSAPFRILDAPDIVDDYYLNLISWSKDNMLAVALAQSVYLWNASNGAINHLVTLEGANEYVTSVSWCGLSGMTKYIAIGTNACLVHLYDGQVLRKVRTISGHTGRVSSMAWNQNWVTSGSRDSSILNHDARVPTSAVARYRGHQQEVCGLKWNEDGSCLASGGNENYLCLWDAAMSGRERSNTRQLSNQAPRVILKKHRAAVKAIDWCPFHRGLLATGGGTSDRTIKFWNSSSGAMLNSIDTGSQVCSVIWSRHQRELCSSHGYSENQLILWKYPTMTRVKELPGHTARVLNMEMSPDGASVVSAAADETLRFWNVFGCPTRRNASGMPDNVNFGTPSIR